MKTKKYLLGALAVFALSLGACHDDDTTVFVEGANAGLEAPEALEAGATYLKMQTPFHINSQTQWTAAGYCVGTSANPDIYSAVFKADVTDGMGFAGTVHDGYITATIPALQPNTEYHIRAYVSIYKGDVIYSPECVVSTIDGNLDEALASYKGPQYPDDYTPYAAWSNRSKWNLGNVHDPTVFKADDGYYYMYQTDASYGAVDVGHGHFFGRRSKDLVNWEFLGATMPGLPEWVESKCNEIRATQDLAPLTLKEYDCGYWAPVARNLGNGTYRMYYSIVIPGAIEEGSKDGFEAWGERAFIGMMETTDPASNKWEDKGYVICSSTDRGNNYWCSGDWANGYYRFNAIDPSYVVTPEGQHWLIYGSWHSGIAALQVDASTGMPVNALGNPVGNSAAEISSYGQCIYTRTAGNRWQASEGPEVIYRDGYYYLFLAYDGLDVPYNTRVVRSKSVTGPYLGIDGTNGTEGGEAYPVVTHPYAFQGNHGWVGISHCAVFEDGEGNWYYASQARYPQNFGGNEASNAIMLGHVRSILWTSDGWPVVLPERYGKVPQVALTEAEMAGTWEIIDLSYQYGAMRESTMVVLGADNKVLDGIWKDATWSFDAAKNILKIGSVELCVARECNWESAKREATIVAAGISGTTTFWGKHL